MISITILYAVRMLPYIIHKHLFLLRVYNVPIALTYTLRYKKKTGVIIYAFLICNLYITLNGVYLFVTSTYTLYVQNGFVGMSVWVRCERD